MKEPHLTNRRWQGLISPSESQLFPTIRNALTRDTLKERRTALRGTKTHFKVRRDVSWMFYFVRCTTPNTTWTDNGPMFLFFWGSISSSIWFSALVELEVTCPSGFYFITICTEKRLRPIRQGVQNVSFKLNAILILFVDLQMHHLDNKLDLI
jgi:hypothetical protein